MKRDLDKAIQESKDACKEVLSRTYKEMGLDISSLDYAEQETRRQELDITKPEGVRIKSQYEDRSEIGREAVMASYLLFKQAGFKMLQPNWILWHKNTCYCVEIKHQTPQDGMFLLPQKQVLSRLELQAKFGIVAVIMILNRLDEKWYWQYLTKLNEATMVVHDKYKLYLFPISDFVLGYFSVE